MSMELLANYAILPEFGDWAPDALRENHEAEDGARD
jgi:hypothetical protein